DRLGRLIESVLDYAGLEAARPPGTVQGLDAAGLAGEVVGELRAAAEGKGLALTLSVAAGLPPVQGEPRLLRLVLGNLLDNAIKFTERGEIAVTLAPAPDGLRIMVRDSGPGIPPEQQAAVFEPFAHLEPLQGKHTPGVGLGLTVVRELVRSMGGRV